MFKQPNSARERVGNGGPRGSVDDLAGGATDDHRCNWHLCEMYFSELYFYDKLEGRDGERVYVLKRPNVARGRGGAKKRWRRFRTRRNS